MKSLLVSSVLLVLLALSQISVAQLKDAEHHVVVVELADGDDGPKPPSEIEFREPTTVRVTGSVRSGGAVSAKILGSGKLLRSASIARMIGGHTAIGAAEKEFDVQLSKGTTTVVVSASVPQDKTLNKSITYTFVVK